MSAAPTALYVYGVVSADAVLAPEVDSTDVRLIREGEVAALAVTVPLAEFGEEALRKNLEDRGWLETTARAHDAVLERALEANTVVPFRIATLYASEESLHEFLRERQAALVEVLETLDGKVELGVKAYLDRSDAAAQPSESESGQDYLRRRQAEATAKRQADTFALECAHESHAKLSAAALDARTNRPQSPELSGRSEQMLLNGAYLVPRGDTGLESAVQELRRLFGERGVTYELTGPWPPYNFVPRDLASA